MNHNPKELSAQYKKRIDEGIVALKKHPPSEMGEPSSSIVANIARGGYYGLVNHTLTESGIVKDEQKLSPQRGRKAGWANAGRTVTTNDKLDSTEIHPSYPRRFTVRECMRIQSIPDWYAFPDETTGVTDRKEKISLSAQYRIVGNGVPTLLAVQLARQLSRAFGLGEA